MHRLLNNYLADSSKQIQKIEASVKQKQYGALQDYCHALKGNCLSVGAIQLATTTEIVGRFNASTHATMAVEMLANLNSGFAKLTLSIEDYLKRPEAASNE